MWIDKEQSENLSMPGFRRVRQAEWTDSVLHRVWGMSGDVVRW